MHKFTKIKSDYPDSRHGINDFTARTRVAIKFQLVFYDFKTLKKIDTVKTYFFGLLGVYLINKLASSIISKLEKRDQKNKE